MSTPTSTVTADQPALPRRPAPSRGQRLAINLTVGLLAGGLSRLITAPEERISLLLRTQRSNPLVLSGIVAPYKGHWDCFFRVAEEQGFLAFHRGSLVGILRNVPQQLASFLLSDAIEQALPRYDKNTDFWKAFLTRALGGWISGLGVALVCAPFDLARTRLASDMAPGPAQFTGTLDLWKTVIWNNGLSGLFTGIVSAGASALLYRLVQLACFQKIQDMNPYRSDKGVAGAVSSFAAVTLARSLVLPFSYPIDSLRFHMYVEADLPPDEKQYEGSVDALLKITERHGLSSLFTGVGLEFTRGILGALVIVAYDRVAQYLRR